MLWPSVCEVGKMGITQRRLVLGGINALGMVQNSVSYHRRPRTAPPQNATLSIPATKRDESWLSDLKLSRV